MGRVIKRGNAEPGDITPDTGFADTGVSKSHNIITADTFEAKAESQQILERAEAEAQAIRQQADTDAAQTRQQAIDDGEQIRAQAKEDGFAAGKEAAASELSEIVAQSSRRLQQIEEQAVPQLKELALSIARKIIGKELQFHPDAVVDIIKQALSEKARQRREIFLRVHPEDLAAIREHKADLLEVLSRSKEIGLREDPDVERYGVIIETDAGIIDAQLETQLAVFERVLKDNS